MRSRYSAFVKRDGAYLARTQTKVVAPEAFFDDDTRTNWLGLRVLDRAQGGVGDTTGEVAFEARFLEGHEVHVLAERSRFVKDPAWRYVDGDTQVRTEKVERNAPCPCGSGKKFKACHA